MLGWKGLLITSNSHLTVKKKKFLKNWLLTVRFDGVFKLIIT